MHGHRPVTAPEPAPGQAARTPGQAASPLLCHNQEVMDALMEAMGNPGRFLPRAPMESHSSWQRRAIVEHIAPLIIAHAAAQERPAPGFGTLRPVADAYLYHWRFDLGEEFGLYRQRADADAKAAEHAGDGLTEVLGMAILGRPEPAGERPAPVDPLWVTPGDGTTVGGLLAHVGVERPAPGNPADWWVCDGPLPDGKKITGPFATQELALTVRAYVENAGQRTDLWVDDEAAGERPAPECRASQSGNCLQLTHGHAACADGECIDGAMDDAVASLKRERPAPEPGDDSEVRELRGLLDEVLASISAGEFTATASRHLNKLSRWYKRGGIEQP